MTLKDGGTATGPTAEDLERPGESVLRDIPDAVIYADQGHHSVPERWRGSYFLLLTAHPEKGRAESAGCA
jgi:hypothetical protein